MKCILCKKNPIYANDLCAACYDAIFYLEDIIDNYFAGVHKTIADILKEFTFIYASYLQLTGYYTTTIQVMLHFITNLTRTTITNAQLNNFNFTKLSTDDLIDVLVRAKLLIINPATPGIYTRGDLAQNLATQLRDALERNPNEIKEPAEQFFGIISLILTNALIKRKIADPTQVILPRKAISLFLLFANIIIQSENNGTPIPNTIDISFIKEQCKIIGLTDDTINNLFYELMGFSIRSPGKTNIIKQVDLSDEKVILKDNVVKFLERERDRRRDRIRVRGA